MIVQVLLDFFHGLAVNLFGWLRGALPQPPHFVEDFTTSIDTVVQMIPGAVRYFVPLAPIAAAGAAFVGLLLVVGALKVARRVLSLFTGGGGNA